MSTVIVCFARELRSPGGIPNVDWVIDGSESYCRAVDSPNKPLRTGLQIHRVSVHAGNFCSNPDLVVATGATWSALLGILREFVSLGLCI